MRATAKARRRNAKKTYDKDFADDVDRETELTRLSFLPAIKVIREICAIFVHEFFFASPFAFFAPSRF